MSEWFTTRGTEFHLHQIPLLLTWKPPSCRSEKWKQQRCLDKSTPLRHSIAVLGLVWGCGEGCPGSGILLFIPDLSCITSNTEGTCRAGEGVLQLGEEARDSSQCVIALIRREGSGQSRQQRATETHTMERSGFLFAGGGEQVSANDASHSCN